MSRHRADLQRNYRCTGGGGCGRGIKNDPPPKFLQILKTCTLPQKFPQPLFTLPLKIKQKPYGLYPWIFKPVASMIMNIHRAMQKKI